MYKIVSTLTPPEIVARLGADGKADIFVIIGTSMNVYPAAGLLHDVRDDIPVFLIDPKDVSTNRFDLHHIKKGASECVKELKQFIL